MSQTKEVTHIDNIKLSEDEKAVIIIDQTKLPNVTEYLTINSAESLYDAIKKLRVRGHQPLVYVQVMESMY